VDPSRDFGKHQAQQALELLKQEIDRNRIAVKNDMRSGDIGELDHRAALAVLRRLRSSTLRPDDRLIFIRKFSPLGSTAWRVVHESGAAAYVPYEQMAKYGEIYDAQQRINDGAMSVYADLQRATAVLNAETEDQSRDEEDRIQNEAENADAQLALRSPDSRSEAAENAINIRLSGNPDLRRLTPAQIDRLEQGFQQAITDDLRKTSHSFVVTSLSHRPNSNEIGGLVEISKETRWKNSSGSDEREWS
jgi:hypothetical protein